MKIINTPTFFFKIIVSYLKLINGIAATFVFKQHFICTAVAEDDDAPFSLCACVFTYQ